MHGDHDNVVTDLIIELEIVKAENQLLRQHISTLRNT